MFNKRSFFKRASRSLAKTGFFPFSFCVSFSLFFLVVFRDAFSALLAPFGPHLGAFWQTFRHFLELCGLLLDCTPSQAKTYIFMFWSSPAGTFSCIFPGGDLGYVFNGFYAVFCDFGSPLGSLWAPFGPPFSRN